MTSITFIYTAQNKQYDIPIYELDTKSSILLRLASRISTLSKYIFIYDGLPVEFDTNQEYRFINILDYLFQNNLSFEDIYDILAKDSILEQQNLDLYNDILLPHVSYLSTLDTDIDQAFVILLVNDSITKTDAFEQDIDIESLYNDKIYKDILKNVESVQTEAKKQETTFDKFINTVAIAYTQFQVESVKYEALMEVKVSLNQVFNMIKLLPDIPFCTMSNIFKIYNNFSVPDESWHITTDDIIYIKVKEGDATFRNVIMGLSGSILKIFIHTSNDISKEESLSNVLRIIPDLEYTNVDISANNLIGNYEIPTLSFNNYLLTDIILNDPNFSSFITVDETRDLNKKNNSLFGYYSTGTTTEYLSFNMIPRLSDTNTPYIRVHVNCNSVNILEKFQDVLGKLLTLYKDQEESLFAFYKKYIPDFILETTILPIIPKKVTLKTVAPEIFINGYSTRCSVKPDIIPDDNISQYNNVMIFPNKDSSLKQRNYVCKNGYYPGIRPNPLENSDKVPYLPCCYKKDYSNEKGSLYRHYFYDEELKTKNTKQQNIINTVKLVGENIFGVLPTELNKTFSIFDIDYDTRYLRVGVKNSSYTLIQCILTALSLDTTIEDVIEQITRSEYISISKQEMYDYTNGQIKATIRDTNQYFNGRLFGSVLEIYFQCNVYIFTKDGTLLLPRSYQGYYKNKLRYEKSVYIYESWGSKSDNVKEPRYELVINTKDNDTIPSISSVTKVFDAQHSLVKNTQKYYKQILNYKVYSDKYTPFTLNSQEIVIKSQYIDKYGKCRYVNIVHKGKKGVFITDPCQPLLVKNVQYKIRKMNVSDILDFNWEIIEQSIVYDTVKQVTCLVANSTVSIPVVDTAPINDIPVVNSIKYIDSNTSGFESYLKHKRIARYVKEYTYWLYSTHVETKGPISVENFARKYLSINKDFVYDYIPSNFTVNNSGIMNNKKIIVKSQACLDKLIYNLKLWIYNNPKKIREYHTYKTIPSYYLDITDYDKYPNQLLVFGADNISKIEQLSEVYTSPNSSIKTRYFLYYNNTINIAYNVTDLSLFSNNTIYVNNKKIQEGQDRDVYILENNNTYTVLNF